MLAGSSNSFKKMQNMTEFKNYMHLIKTSKDSFKQKQPQSRPTTLGGNSSTIQETLSIAKKTAKSLKKLDMSLHPAAIANLHQPITSSDHIFLKTSGGAITTTKTTHGIMFGHQSS